MMGDIGDSAGTQTQDLQNRNLTLYSTKLRDQNGRGIGQMPATPKIN